MTAMMEILYRSEAILDCFINVVWTKGERERDQNKKVMPLAIVFIRGIQELDTK